MILSSSEGYIDEGRKYFRNSGFPTTFVQADAYKYADDKQYGLVICQAFLRHLPNARLLLKNMVDFTELDGIVACIEVARGIENSCMAIKGLNCPEIPCNAFSGITCERI